MRWFTVTAFLDDQLLDDPEIQAAISNSSSVTKMYEVVNTDRTIGARLAAIATRYGNSGFVGQINLNFIGSVGQSFGAFNLAGMILKLEGNDYVGRDAWW